MKMQKKGAIELSVSTIVIVVLAMSMLILGLVLVKNIFSGVTYNVKTVDDGVKAKINELFNEKEGKIFVYLPDNIAEVKQGKSFGVAFAIKNTVTGEAGDSEFTYETRVAEVQSGCSLSLEQANKYVSLGKSGKVTLSPGGVGYDRSIFIVPSSAPLCIVKYVLEVKRKGQAYDSVFFYLDIK